MPVNARFEGDVVILSNFGRLLNDPRHFDTSREVRALLDAGHRTFIFDLVGLRDLGSAGLGLLMTLTRLIRQYDGDAVLADLGPLAEKTLEDMRMDSVWDVFPDIDSARTFLASRTNDR